MEVQFAARGSADLRGEVGQVPGGLEFDFAVLGLHLGGAVGLGFAGGFCLFV